MMYRVCSWLMALCMVPAGIGMAQESTSQNEEKSSTIFDQIKIELLDLRELGEDVDDNLVGEAYRLSLEECVLLALVNNKDIEIIEFETLLADADVLSAKGIFDPTFSALINHADSSNPPSPTEEVFGGFSESIESKNTDYQLKIDGLLTYWGTRYSVDYGVNREAGTFTTNPITNEELSIYTGGLTTTLTQPLLRGRGTDINKVYIRTAENSQKIAASEIRRVALQTLSMTVQAYWDLVGAIQNLEVRKQSLDNALRLVKINERRLEIGTAAAIEVLQAKAEAASRQSDFIVARMNILDAEDILKNYILPEDIKDFISMSILPTTRPAQPTYEWNLERSLQTALKQRPELESAQLYVENATLEVGRTKNEKLPQLDANLSYVQSTRDFDHGDVPEGIKDKDGRRWVVGLSGSFPIGNRNAKGAHIRAEQIERQQQRRLAKTKQDIEVEVRQAVRGVVTSEILIESNRQARILQEANVVAEEKRLNLGVTTSQDVLDRQEDLTAAQTQELQSIVDYEKSLIQLQLAEGTLLDQLNISWDRLDERPLSTIAPE